MIKCCGLTRLEDVDVINMSRPDYAGFVLAPSKRQIKDSWLLKQLIQRLRNDIIPVGVFVNPSFEVIQETVACGIKVVQLHGDETVKEIKDYKRSLPNTEFWKAYRFGNSGKTIEEQMTTLKSWIDEESIQQVLVDYYDGNHYGGTGKTLDWKAFSDSGLCSKLILAGGLTGSNVSEAIRTFKPRGVDVSSGIEKNGIKSLKLTQHFVRSARAEFSAIGIKNN